MELRWLFQNYFHPSLFQMKGGDFNGKAALNSSCLELSLFHLKLQQTKESPGKMLKVQIQYFMPRGPDLVTLVSSSGISFLLNVSGKVSLTHY